MASFNNSKQAEEYAKTHTEDFNAFMETQLLSPQSIAGYDSFSEEKKAKVNKEIEEYNEIVKKQFSVYNFPHKK